MAKKQRYKFLAIEPSEVKEILTWVRREIKAELEDLCDENVRFMKIEYEIGRFLRKYNLI